jgi:hypothetical protein
MKKLFNIYISKTDIIIICVILASVFVSLLLIFNRSHESNVVIIQVNNAIYEIRSLCEDSITQIGNFATLQIFEGNARILNSTCRNQHCVMKNWSNRTPIICVPNRILIEFILQESIQNEEEMFITR